MKKSLRNLLIFLGIAVALFAGYKIFFNKTPAQAPTTSALSSTTRTSATVPLAASGTTTAGSQLLALLGRVTTLTLNDDIFANPAFTLLQDISIILPPVEARGRRNPFAPISTTNAPTTTTQLTETGGTAGTGTNPQ